jgi:hypothetical protein
MRRKRTPQVHRSAAELLGAPVLSPRSPSAAFAVPDDAVSAKPRARGRAAPATLRPSPGEVPPLAEGERLPWWPCPVQAWGPGYGPDSPAPRCWWLGCHGGAGVSTLATWIPGGLDAVRAWPDPRIGGPAPLVLVARDSVHGLRAALCAVRQWAAHDVPPIELVGTVVIAATPASTLYPIQTDLLEHLRAAIGTVWRIPWIDELPVAVPSDLRAVPPAIGALVADLATLVPPAAPTPWELS